MTDHEIVELVLAQMEDEKTPVPEAEVPRYIELGIMLIRLVRFFKREFSEFYEEFRAEFLD